MNIVSLGLKRFENPVKKAGTSSNPPIDRQSVSGYRFSEWPVE
jgi:hypothetical protein